MLKLFGIVMMAGCALAGLSLSAFAATGSFELQVNDVSGLDSPWPLVGGLPFPEGEVSDPARIRIVNAQGEEVPAQIDVTATWPDGSLRWALAGINASPQGEYRVEYGPDVSRFVPERPLSVKQDADGEIVVDTGAAVYEFLPDRLLPESGRMADTVFLAGSGDGAYLVDNHGRLARVAGVKADVETNILKQGPVRTVIRRCGWYVTRDGERVARAKMWFYFTAGSPFVRITHSIVFTEDTNKLWVRDYGLEFRAPEEPREAVFALSEATWTDTYIGGRGPEDKEERRELADMFSSGLVEREQTLFPVALDGGEVYMLQDNYPHGLERTFRAIVARAPSPLMMGDGAVDEGNAWVHSWLKEFDVAGDWAEARFDGHALGVVMPQLAQRFPKEIAVGPKGARVAFWSGRSGRELDFRAVTLVNEYWKEWADQAVHAVGLFDPGKSNRGRGPAVASKVARQPSNARSAARTHDVWLLPRTGAVSEWELKARATAAAHPPLLEPELTWMGDSKAIGWPMQPKDTARFPEVEETISEGWEEIVGGPYGHAQVRRTGFMMWGKSVTLGTGPRWFRLSTPGRYGLDRSAWQLYMRSGERRYYDYGRHFSRFTGDLHVHHWTAGDKFRGGFSNAGAHLPFYWGTGSRLSGRSTFWTFGWLMDYYLTGDEYPHELCLMVADAFREHADSVSMEPAFNSIFNLSMLYQHTRDEAIKDLARKVAYSLIDLDNPTGLNDRVRYGVYYKPGTEWLLPLYFYYNATGDETAREVILRAMDEKFRFFYSSNQTFRLFLFAEAYHWTDKSSYLRLIDLMVQHPIFSLMGHNFLFGAPVALHAIAHAEKPIEPFPVLAATRMPEADNVKKESVVRSNFVGVPMDHTFVEADALPSLLVTKQADAPVNLSIYVRVSKDVSENTAPVARIVNHLNGAAGLKLPGVHVKKEQRFKSRNKGRNDPRRWHLRLTLPAEAEAGQYKLEFPNAETFIVLESDATDLRLGAGMTKDK